MASSEDKFTERLASVVEDAGGASAVARALGNIITPGAVRLWTLGTKPHQQHIMALCEKLGLDRTWLLTGEEGKGSSRPVNFPTSLLREEEASLAYAGFSDDQLAAKIVELVKNYSRVPLPYATIALEELRAHLTEFLARAERRVQGRTVKYPAVKSSNHKRK